MFDFNFPEYGVICKICECDIPLERYRQNGLCDDCAFDKLTPEAWPELFLAELAKWKAHEAT